jgi:hypothetical protein
MFSKEYRVRKSTPFTQLGDDPIECSIHFLTRWKYGLRISITRTLQDGSVVLILVKGNTANKNRYKVYKKMDLRIPSQHQLDVAVSILVSLSNSKLFTKL